MKVKVVLLISAMLVFVGCSADVEKAEEMPEETNVVTEEVVSEESKELMEEEKETDMEKDEMMLELTLDELAEFDGSNGDVIYVAVDGVIYDVSHLDLWKGGQHKAGITAGKDLTKEIKEMSPHGVGILKRATIVGKIIE